MWQTNLVKLYCTVCDNHSIIEEVMQRQSNNNRPQFTDEECITIYLWGIAQRRFEQKAIYNYVKNHLNDWFPDLPSYQAFSRRLGALSPAFRRLAEIWMEQMNDREKSQMEFAVDSCPIILAKQRRSSHGKVAPEICNKSYCSSRNEWYYGVKLHAFTARHTGALATPCALMLTPAADNDLTVAKQIMEDCRPVHDGVLYADKAYCDEEWKEHLAKEFSLEIRTPRKKKLYDTVCSGDAFSSFVSGLRQQIEIFFNWLQQKTNIQSASKVRSTSGLFSHVFGKIAAAILCRLLYS